MRVYHSTTPCFHCHDRRHHRVIAASLPPSAIMPPKKTPATPSSSHGEPVADALAALEKRVSGLEDKQRRKNLFAIARQKKDLLNAEVKSYSDNFLIKGIKYSMKEVHGDEEKEERFREKVLRVFVDQGLVSAKKLFVGGAGDNRGRIQRGVLRHCHPLGNKDNGSVVVAFLESWFVSHINQKLTAGKKLTGGIRITPHLPPIIDSLRNEALKSRRTMLQADPNRKIVLKRLNRKPWIELVETVNGRKKAIPFDVDDKRLVNPALTLAKLELEGKDTFTPKMLLPADEKRAYGPGVYRPLENDDDNVDVDADESLMEFQ